MPVLGCISGVSVGTLELPPGCGLGVWLGLGVGCGAIVIE